MELLDDIIVLEILFMEDFMDKDMKFMDYATCLAKSANCIKGKVGAVIVKGG